MEQNNGTGGLPALNMTCIGNLTCIANLTSIGNLTCSSNGSFPDWPEVPDGVQWGWWLLQLGTPLLVLIGVPGNILSLLVLKSCRYRTKSYSHYLCTLAVFDSLVLIGKSLRRLDSLLIHTDNKGIFMSFGDAACKVHNFTEHVCYLMSSWIVLCMTLERFIAVNYPFKKEFFCKPRNAVTIILVVFAFTSYSQIFRLIVIEKSSTDLSCVAADRYRHIYVAMHVYLYQLVLQFFFPALLILVCNLSVLIKIRQMRQSVAKQGDAHSRHAYAKRSKTTFMLLAISFTFVLALFPTVFVSLLMHILVYTNPAMAQTVFYNLTNVKDLLELISEINYAVNFYIYVMSGAQFRYELRNVLMRRYTFISNGGDRVVQFRKSYSS